MSDDRAYQLPRVSYGLEYVASRNVVPELGTAHTAKWSIIGFVDLFFIIAQ